MILQQVSSCRRLSFQWNQKRSVNFIVMRDIRKTWGDFQLTCFLWLLRRWDEAVCSIKSNFLTFCFEKNTSLFIFVAALQLSVLNFENLILFNLFYFTVSSWTPSLTWTIFVKFMDLRQSFILKPYEKEVTFNRQSTAHQFAAAPTIVQDVAPLGAKQCSRQKIKTARLCLSAARKVFSGKKTNAH